MCYKNVEKKVFNRRQWNISMYIYSITQEDMVAAIELSKMHKIVQPSKRFKSREIDIYGCGWCSTPGITSLSLWFSALESLPVCLCEWSLHCLACSLSHDSELMSWGELTSLFIQSGRTVTSPLGNLSLHDYGRCQSIDHCMNSAASVHHLAQTQPHHQLEFQCGPVRSWAKDMTGINHFLIHWVAGAMEVEIVVWKTVPCGNCGMEYCR